MKSLTHLTIGVLLVTLTLVVATKTATAQDPAKVASQIYKVIFENDRVRVLEAHYKVGDKSVMHSHPDSLIYVLTPAKIRLTQPDGKTIDIESKVEDVGKVIWQEATTHASENVGPEHRVLVIELKK
jgi:quercetin dioxygenase-like cupin family protein